MLKYILSYVRLLLELEVERLDLDPNFSAYWLSALGKHIELSESSSSSILF